MNAYSPKEYWTGVAEHAGATDSSAFAPVLHPDAPAWFNELIDELQFRAVRKALALSGIQTGAEILDVGCGTGRWVRRFQDIGFQPMGIDATEGMLRLARRHTVSPLLAGEALNLPFTEGTFDAVTDITVVQHIPGELQSKALAEMIRVLKPDGSLILLELTRGKGVHIFPREPQDWVKQVTACGGKLVGCFGQEFLVFDRAFVHLVRSLARRNGGRSEPRAPEPGVVSHNMSTSRRIFWELRHVTASISAWCDPAAERLLPQKLATHGVFIFRK